jgi:Glyoxalase-like domain
LKECAVPAKFKDLCLDAADARALAEWWCTAMDYRLAPGTESDDHGKWAGAIEDPSGKGPLIWITPVPEAKTLKNRMHHDVFGDVQELLALGATLVRSRDEEIAWTVMADPEGNEFCVFTPKD